MKKEASFFKSKPIISNLKKFEGLYGITVPNKYLYLHELIKMIVKTGSKVTIRFHAERISMDVISVIM